MNLLACFICVLITGAFGDIATSEDDDAGFYDFQKYFFSPRSGRSFDADLPQFEPEASHSKHDVPHFEHDEFKEFHEVNNETEDVDQPRSGRSFEVVSHDVPHFEHDEFKEFHEVNNETEDADEPRSGRSFEVVSHDLPHFGHEVPHSGHSVPRFGPVSHFQHDQFEDEASNETEESEGRLFPGAPSFFARLAFRVMLWKILRAAAQYFVDIIVAELFG